MIKKLIILTIMILIPIMGGMFGFHVGNSTITVSASETSDKTNDDTILKGNSLSDAEKLIREIVWDKIRPSSTIHSFKHTNEKELFVQAGFTNIKKDMKKTLNILEEVHTKCKEVVEYYYISFIGDNNKELIKMEFSSEMLSQLNFEELKSVDIENIANSYYIDESLIVTE